MAYLSPIGNGYSFLINGAPANGAKLFIYTAGSTTKATTYSDSAGTVPNTNPIVLNARGESANAIWINAGTYKFVLAPSTDSDPPVSPVWTIDNVVGINDTSTAVTEWVAGPTPTYVSATQFTLVGDQTVLFHVNRRMKLTVGAGTVYEKITAVAYTTLTTVTLNSGVLDSGLSAVEYSRLSATNPSVPGNYVNLVTGDARYAALAGTTAQPFATANLAFPAVQVPSANVNTLDDYEEGTWTPFFTFSGSNAGAIHSFQIGEYIKVGKLVTVFAKCIFSAKGSSVGQLTLEGFPFTNISSASNACVIYPQNITYSGSIYCELISSAINAKFWQMSEAGTVTSITNVNCSDTTGVCLTVSYVSAN